MNWSSNNIVYWILLLLSVSVFFATVSIGNMSYPKGGETLTLSWIAFYVSLLSAGVLGVFGLVWGKGLLFRLISILLGVVPLVVLALFL